MLQSIDIRIHKMNAAVITGNGCFLCSFFKRMKASWRQTKILFYTVSIIKMYLQKNAIIFLLKHPTPRSDRLYIQGMAEFVIKVSIRDRCIFGWLFPALFDYFDIFHPNKQINASVNVNASTAWIIILESNERSCCVQAMPAIPIQWAPGEIFLMPTFKCPWSFNAKGLQSQNAAISCCCFVRFLPV